MRGSLARVIFAMSLLSCGQALATDNLGLPTIPLRILNNTGSTQDLYVSIVGVSGTTWYSVIDLKGDVAPTTFSPNPSAFAIDIGAASAVKMQLPQLQGVRVYVSIGAPLYVNTSPSGVPGAPAGWIATDPNYNTLFDWAELTWVPNAVGSVSALGGNVTQVDMFGLAMKLSLTGLASNLTTKATYTSGFDATPGTTRRQDILNGIAAAGSPWNALVLRNTNGQPFRAMSPYHGIETGVFPSTQLQTLIDQAFAKYAAGGVSAQTAGVSFTGQMSGGEMIFTNTATGATFQIPEPTTYSAYTGNFAPTPPPSDSTLEQEGLAIGAQLQGAFMRGDILKNGNLTACDKAQFYKASPVNEYAHVIHENAVKGLAYAFGFDDTCSQSSYIGVYAPIAMTLEIGPL